MTRSRKTRDDAVGAVKLSLSRTRERKTSAVKIGVLLSILLIAASSLCYTRIYEQWVLATLETYRLFGSSNHDTPTRNFSLNDGFDDRLSLDQLLKACKEHRYTSEIISLDPLVIYINNFTSKQEAEQLINIGSPEFTDSFISRSGVNRLVTGRTSSSAPLSEDSPLVACILCRARKFMGSMMLPHEPFSVPQIVRYFPGQKYDLHTDFWPEHQVMNDGSGRKFNRVASFFVFLRDNCTEGYTYFPRVQPAHDSAEAPVDLDTIYDGKVARGESDGEEKGVKFKPIQGNALFWINVDEKGQGDRRLIHAGLPVGQGEKIGLNIWPRKFYGYVEGAEQPVARQGWNGQWKK